MNYECRRIALSVVLAITGIVIGDSTRRAEGKTYKFTSQVRSVISPSSPSAVFDLPFAAGQKVTGTFAYVPQDAVLAEPPTDGQADYLNGFRGLSLTIDLGGSEYKLVAPDVATPGETPLAGRPLNRISIDDNIPVNVDERADRFSLQHDNSFFFDRPLAQVDPASIIERFFPTSFFASWRTTAGPGQPMPEFITDFSLPNDLNELFARSDNDNWALQFVELPAPGTSMPGRSVNVLGSIETLIVIPEPVTCSLLCVALVSMMGSRRGSRLIAA